MVPHFLLAMNSHERNYYILQKIILLLNELKIFFSTLQNKNVRHLSHSDVPLMEDVFLSNICAMEHQIAWTDMMKIHDFAQQVISTTTLDTYNLFQSTFIALHHCKFMLLDSTCFTYLTCFRTLYLWYNKSENWDSIGKMNYVLNMTLT